MSKPSKKRQSKTSSPKRIQYSGAVLFAEKESNQALSEAVRGALRQQYSRRDLRRDRG